MEKSLILFIVLFLIPFSVLSFYLGFIRRGLFDWKAQSAFFVSVALIIVSIILLWKQSGAVERLAATGIVPYPTIKSVDGVMCGEGDNPDWLFDADESTNEEDVRKFYLDKANRPGWELTNADNTMMLFLKKGDRKMQISFAKSWTSMTLEYKMTREGSSPLENR